MPSPVFLVSSLRQTLNLNATYKTALTLDYFNVTGKILGVLQSKKGDVTGDFVKYTGISVAT